MELLEADLKMSHDLLDQSRQAELEMSYHSTQLEEVSHMLPTCSLMAFTL